MNYVDLSNVTITWYPMTTTPAQFREPYRTTAWVGRLVPEIEQ